MGKRFEKREVLPVMRSGPGTAEALRRGGSKFIAAIFFEDSALLIVKIFVPRAERLRRRAAAPQPKRGIAILAMSPARQDTRATKSA